VTPSVVVYSTWSDLPPVYRRAFDVPAACSYFLSLRWFEDLWNTCGRPGIELRLYGVENDGAEPLGLLVARTPAEAGGSILEGRRPGPRTLSGLTNFETRIFAPLLSPAVSDPAPVLRALSRAIAGELPQWTLVDLNMLDPGTPEFREIGEALRQAGLTVRAYFQCSNWYEETEGLSSEEYLRSRPKGVRREFPRIRRKLQRTRDVRFELITEPADVDRGLALYGRVHEASWKQSGASPDFLPTLLRGTAAAGALRLGILHVDGAPVAGLIAFVTAGAASLYRTAYDPGFRSFSVGSLVFLYVIEHLLDVDRVRELDFGRYDYPYKSLWVSKRREYWGIIAFNTRTVPGMLQLARHELGRGAQAVRRLLKPVLRPPLMALQRALAKRRGGPPPPEPRSDDA